MRPAWRTTIKAALLSRDGFFEIGLIECLAVGSLRTFDVALLEPRHEVSETLPDLLDLVLLTLFAKNFEIRTACFGFLDPLLRKLAALDVLEGTLHLLFHRALDDRRSGFHIAPLCGLRDGESHSGNAGLVDEVDGELKLVEALKVGHLGLVSRFDKRLESSRDKLADATAKNGLLSEEIRLGLFLESGLEDTGTSTTDSLGPGESNLLCVTSWVLLDRDERRNTLPFNELTTDNVSWPLWSNHDDVDKIGEIDRFEMDRKSVAEEKRLSFLKIRKDV